MNKKRLAQIADLATRIQSASELLEELQAEVDALEGEESEYHDNMPDSLRNGEKGERAQAAIDSLTEALYQLQEAAQIVRGAAESLQNIE